MRRSNVAKIHWYDLSLFHDPPASLYCTQPLGLHAICKLGEHEMENSVSLHGLFNSGDIRSTRGIPAPISDQPMSAGVKINIVQHSSEAVKEETRTATSNSKFVIIKTDEPEYHSDCCGFKSDQINHHFKVWHCACCKKCSHQLKKNLN